jgi:hypothetical protein
VTISLTPGAADATKSNILARGPTRATSGSLSCWEMYWRSDASVSMDMAHRSGITSRSSKPTGAVS